MIELAYEGARPLMSPAGGHVELTGRVQSDADVAAVILATRAGAVVDTTLSPRNGGAPQRWQALIAAATMAEPSERVRISAWDRGGRAAQVDISEALPLPPHQPWSIDEFQAALAAGEPLLICARPSFDGCAVVAETLLVEGWAWAPSGIVGCSAQLDDEAPVQAVNGIASPGLRPLLGEHPGLDKAAFRVACQVAHQSPGRRMLVVEARTGDGEQLRWGAPITVDPALVYRRRLIRGPRAPASLPEAVTQAPRLQVWPLGGEHARLQAGLERQHYPWHRLAEGGDVMSGLRAAAAADDELTILVDGDPELRAGALTAFAAAALDGPEAGAFYADHDGAGERGERRDPWLKPDWSPEHLLAVDYLGPLLAIRAEPARAVLRDEAPVSSLYDLALRLVSLGTPVGHLDRIASTLPGGAHAGDPADARAAIERLARRRGRRVVIEQLDAGRRRVSWPIDDPPLVSVVIPTAGLDQMIDRCLALLRDRTAHQRLQVVVVNTSGAPLAPEGADEVIDLRGRFNFSTACNAGVGRSEGEVLVFLNDDIEIQSPDWIERMLDHALAPDVGPVAPKLLYPDGSIQHAGVTVAEPPGGASNLLRGLREPAGGPAAGMLSVVCNLSAVSGACMMIARERFDAIDGFNEEFPVEWGDVDLCLRAGRAGLRTVYTPHAVLIHHESKSRGGATSVDDLARFHEQWAAAFSEGDPYWPFGPSGELD